MNDKNENEIELELIISGDVQGVGYRQYVKKIGKKFKIKGSVKNLEDDTVQIRCKGEIKNIEFKNRIVVKKPLEAPLIDVDEIIIENELVKGMVKEKTFIVIPGRIEDELLESNASDINYLNLFRQETNSNFDKMFKKQDESLQKQDETLHKQDEIIQEIKKVTNKQDESLQKQDETIQEIKKVTDKQDESLQKQDETIQEIKKVADKQDETIEEIGNLREDLKLYFDKRIEKLEKEI